MPSPGEGLAQARGSCGGCWPGAPKTRNGRKLIGNFFSFSLFFLFFFYFSCIVNKILLFFPLFSECWFDGTRDWWEWNVQPFSLWKLCHLSTFYIYCILLHNLGIVNFFSSIFFSTACKFCIIWSYFEIIIILHNFYKILSLFALF